MSFYGFYPLVLIEAQAEFRAGMSTADYIFVLRSLISNMLNNDHRLQCTFNDFTKAFDYIVRMIYGISWSISAYGAKYVQVDV